MRNNMMMRLRMMMMYDTLEVWGPFGPRLLTGGPLGLLTSSFTPFGRSGRYVGPA